MGKSTGLWVARTGPRGTRGRWVVVGPRRSAHGTSPKRLRGCVDSVMRWPRESGGDDRRLDHRHGLDREEMVPTFLVPRRGGPVLLSAPLGSVGVPER